MGQTGISGLRGNGSGRESAGCNCHPTRGSGGYLPTCSMEIV